jgi:hypothetical protein
VATVSRLKKIPKKAHNEKIVNVAGLFLYLFALINTIHGRYWKVQVTNNALSAQT